MKVAELKNIQWEEGQIFYLRKYNCTAVLELPIETEEVPIFFSIESDPFGRKNIDLTINRQINYPLLPVKKALLEFILSEDSEGRLPC